MPVPKPTELPRWATDDVVGSDGLNNVVEPSEDKKDVGWEPEFPPRQYQNWLQRLIYQWIAWIDDQLTNYALLRAQNLADVNDRAISRRNLRVAFAGDFAPHAQSPANMTVVVDAGRYASGRDAALRPQQVTAAFVAPIGNPRIDRIVQGPQTGLIHVVAGTPAGVPVAPLVPADRIPLCQVALAPGQTTITDANITDERMAREKQYADDLIAQDNAKVGPNQTITTVETDVAGATLTVAVDGFYLILSHWLVEFTGSTVAAQARLELYAAGVNVKTVSEVADAGNTARHLELAGEQAFRQLVAGDVVKLRTYKTSSSIAATIADCSLSIMRLRP